MNADLIIKTLRTTFCYHPHYHYHPHHLIPLHFLTRPLPQLKKHQTIHIRSDRHATNNKKRAKRARKHRESLLNSLPSNTNEDGPSAYPLIPDTEEDLSPLTIHPQLHRYTATNLTIASLNANGLLTNHKRPLLDTIATTTDICAIQETHILPPTTNKQKSSLKHKLRPLHNGGTLYTSNYKGNSRGTAIYIAKRLSPFIIPNSTITDKEGRIVMIQTTLFPEQTNNQHTWIISIYAPATNDKDKEQFFTDLQNNYLSRIPYTDKIILMGDFNITSHTLDKQGGIPHSTTNASMALDNLTISHTLMDTWRCQHPTEFDYTRSSEAQTNTIPPSQSDTTPNDSPKRPREIEPPQPREPIKSRIDRIFTSPELYPITGETQHIPCTYSDHLWVTTTITPTVPLKSKNPSWKLQASLLLHPRAAQRIRQATTKYFQQPISNHITHWIGWKRKITAICKDILNTSIKGRTKKYITHQSRYQKLAKQPILTPEDITNLQQSRDFIKKMDLHASDKRQQSDRLNYEIKHNRPTKEFLKLHSNRIKTPITALTDPTTNTTTTTTPQMVPIASTFYQQLFRRRDTNPAARQYFHDQTTKANRPLQPHHKSILMAAYTTTEIETLLKNAPTDKAPGPDGINEELYKFLAPQLTIPLTNLFNTITPQDIQTLNWDTSHICIIYKNKGSPKELKNYRPITLLNSDYKLFTKAITTRMATFIKQIIHPDQRGFLPKTNIADNLIRAQTLIDYSMANKEDLFILSIDQEKAFDRLDHKYLFGQLRAKEFPEPFVELIEAIYKDRTTKIIINDLLTDHIPLNSGVVQGDPLSPFLYIISLEGFADTIRHDTSLIGLSDHSHKLALVADDTLLMGKGQTTLDKYTDYLNFYQTASAGKINEDKSYLVHFTQDVKPTPLTHPYKETPTNSHVTYIGTQLGLNIDLKSLWEPLVARVKHRLTQWHNNHTSLNGTTTIINCLVTPILTYQAQFHAIPEEQLTQIHNMTRDFANRHQSLKQSFDTLCLAKSDNGKGMHHIPTHLAAATHKWMRQLLLPYKDQPTWAPLLADLLQYSYQNNLGLTNIHHPNPIGDCASSALWSHIFSNYALLNTTIQQPAHPDSNYYLNIPLTHYKHRYSYNDTPGLSKLPEALGHNGITRIHDLGHQPTPQSLKLLSSLDGQKPMTIQTAKKWLNSLPEPLRNNHANIPITINDHNFTPHVWYKHPTRAKPITQSNNSWHNFPAEQPTDIIHSLTEEELNAPLTQLISYTDTKDKTKIFGTAKDTPAYHLCNIMIQPPNYSAPIPLIQCTNKDIRRTIKASLSKTKQQQPIPTANWAYRLHHPLLPTELIPLRIIYNNLPFCAQRLHDLRYRIFHNNIPAGTRIGEAKSRCSLCKHTHPAITPPTENICHRFNDCYTAKAAWSHMENLLNEPIPLQERLFGTNPNKTDAKAQIKDLFILITQWAIWDHRNHFIHRNPTTTPDSTQSTATTNKCPTKTSSATKPTNKCPIESGPTTKSTLSHLKRQIHNTTRSLSSWLYATKHQHSTLHKESTFYQYAMAISHYPRLLTLKDTHLINSVIHSPTNPSTPTNTTNHTQQHLITPPNDPITSITDQLCRLSLSNNPIPTLTPTNGADKAIQMPTPDSPILHDPGGGGHVRIVDYW
jgi:exonuclease III